jgi:hypothetical protein
MYGKVSYTYGTDTLWYRVPDIQAIWQAGAISKVL